MAAYKITLNENLVQDMLSHPNALGDMMSEVLIRFFLHRRPSELGQRLTGAVRRARTVVTAYVSAC